MSKYDNASLVQIPSGYKAGTLYSVLPANGDGDFDFTRASIATRVNAEGLIEQVASGVPRLDYPILNGVVQSCPALLLEPARTNLIQYSEDFSNNAYWTKSGSSVTSGFISPKGDLSAFKLVESSTTSTHELEVTGIAVVSDKYTISLFAKAGERGKLQVKLRNYFAGDPSVIFDLENGTFEQNVQAIGSMTLLSNGFYKCTFTTVLNAIAGGNAILNVNLVDEANQTSYTGNGTSGVYIYGAQLEQGSYATSYIPTSGTTVARAAEVCNGAGTSAEFNDSEGVLFVEVAAIANDGTTRQISLSDGATVTNRIYFGFRPTANQVILSSRDSSYAIATISDATNLNKFAFKYKSGDFKAFINGFNYSLTLNGGLLPASVSEVNFDDYGTGSSPFYGKTKQLIAFDAALTDEELEDLTSWDSFEEMAASQFYTLY